MASHIRGRGSAEGRDDGDMLFSSQNERHKSRRLRRLRQAERRLDFLEQLGQGECRFTTALNTTLGGTQAATGVMFSVLANQTMDILSFEFDYFPQATDFSVDVYYKSGNFTNFVNNQNAWDQISSTTAVPAPDQTTAIIPVNEEKVVTLNPGTLASFYLTFKSDSTLKVSNSNNQVGAVWQYDNSLQVFVGSLISGSAFPNTAGTPAEFRGVVHYRVTQNCTNFQATSQIPLKFAVNTNPTSNIVSQINAAVNSAVQAVMSLSTDLIQYEKYSQLVLVGVNSGFQGRDRKFSYGRR